MLDGESPGGQRRALTGVSGGPSETAREPSRKAGLPGRAALIAVFALAAAAFALQAQTAKKNSYDNFKMVQTRDIFDPDRSRDLTLQSDIPRRGESRPVATPPPVVATASDYVELTGVMTTEQETFAFFAGSQPEYNKVVAVNGSIAGATITKITSAGIDVARNGRQVTVPVGWTVPLNDSATPALPPSAAPAPVAASTAGTSLSAPSVDPQAASQQVPLPDATSGSSSAPPDNVSDVMRRMMERRQKELSQ